MSGEAFWNLSLVDFAAPSQQSGGTKNGYNFIRLPDKSLQTLLNERTHVKFHSKVPLLLSLVCGSNIMREDRSSQT